VPPGVAGNLVAALRGHEDIGKQKVDLAGVLLRYLQSVFSAHGF
jgi:hypothetical protein